LAGLLIVDVQLNHLPEVPIMKAASEILDEPGPKLKPVLSNMGSGLRRRLGSSTWDAVIERLVAADVVAPAEGTSRPRHRILDRDLRDEIVHRLRAAAGGDDPMPMRTAVLLSMTGPAQLLELVAPDRQNASTPANESTMHSIPLRWSQSPSRFARSCKMLPRPSRWPPPSPRWVR
jgi:hypothetical protein